MLEMLADPSGSRLYASSAIAVEAATSSTCRPVRISDRSLRPSENDPFSYLITDGSYRFLYAAASSTQGLGACAHRLHGALSRPRQVLKVDTFLAQIPTRNIAALQYFSDTPIIKDLGSCRVRQSPARSIDAITRR